MSVLLIYAKIGMLRDVGRDRKVASYARDDVTPPLGLLYLGGALRAAGIDVKVLDDSLTTEDELKREMTRARYVGISSLTPNVPRALELIEMAKGLKRTVILGGAHATSDPPYFLERGADYVVVGEGEETLPELIEALDGGEDPSKVKGVAFPAAGDDDGAVVLTEPRPMLMNLDLLPEPAWDLIDIERYFEAMGFRVFLTLASRGCPNACTFCNKHMSPRRYRKRDPKKVVDEIETYLTRFRAERLYFVDDLFTADTSWVRAVCREIIRRDLDVVWECESRVTGVDLDLFLLMRRAGCIKIHFGVESGSQRILESVNKKIRVDQVLEAARCARLAGIWYKFFLILGFPWETREDLEATRDLVFRAAPDILAVSLLIPMPGSAIWDQMKDRLYPEAMDFEGLHYYHRKPSYRHDNLTHEELEAFRDELTRDYRAYYGSRRRKLARAWEKFRHGMTHPGYLWARLTC